jgi:hypothetical protein
VLALGRGLLDLESPKPEGFKRRRHAAELVAMRELRDRLRVVPPRQVLDGVGQRFHRPHDALADLPQRQGADGHDAEQPSDN